MCNNGRKRIPALLGVGLAIFMISGCAIHYFDQKTGVEHVWGFGHMKMRSSPPNEGVCSVIKGSEIYGIGLGIGIENNYAIAGWAKQHELSAIDENTSVRLDWPDADFFNIRVGSNPPKALPQIIHETGDNNEQGKGKKKLE